MASTPSVCTEAMNNSHTCGQLSAHKNGYVMRRPTLRGDERGGGGGRKDGVVENVFASEMFSHTEQHCLFLAFLFMSVMHLCVRVSERLGMREGIVMSGLSACVCLSLQRSPPAGVWW